MTRCDPTTQELGVGAVASGGLGFLTQSAFYVNAATGNDANDGATPTTALLTLAELARRLNGRTLAASLTDFIVTITGAFPTQVLAAELLVAGPTIVQFQGGAPTQLDSGTVTAFTAMNPAGGVRAALTDAAQDFSGYINKRIRLTSGANVGAVAWICSLGGGNTVANVSEFVASPSLATGWPVATIVTPAVNDTYVIEDLSASCDAHAVRVFGRHAVSPTEGRAYVRDIKFVSAKNAYSQSQGQATSSLIFYGCLWDWSVGGVSYVQQNCTCTWSGCAFLGSGSFFISFVFSRAQELGCAFFGVSNVLDGSTMFAQRNIHDGNGAKNVSRQVDGGATLVDVHHRGFFGNINGTLTSHIHVLDASSWVAESANSRFWGAAGNTVTNALKINNGCEVQYVTLPTSTGAVPGNDVVLAAAVAIAWAAVPAVAAAPNTAAINLRQ